MHKPSTSHRCLPAILTVLTGFLAVVQTATGEPQLRRVNQFVVEIYDEGWSIKYGSIRFESQPHLFKSGVANRVYFSHGAWLRVIDTKQGVVTQRWHLPSEIQDVSERDGRIQVVVVEGSPGSRTRRARFATRTLTLDPANPMMPYVSMGQFRVSRTTAQEAQPFGLVPYRQRRMDQERARELIPQAREAVRRDPQSPWLRVALGTALSGIDDVEAESVLREAIELPGLDFIELLPNSGTLDQAGFPDLARAAFERGKSDFYGKRLDPRLIGSWVRNSLFMEPLSGSTWQTESGRKRIERLYEIFPATEFASYAWRLSQAGSTPKDSGKKHNNGENAHPMQRSSNCFAHRLDSSGWSAPCF